MTPEILGFGRKRPQIEKPVSLLLLDKENPRLPEEAQGSSENELLKVLYQDFNLTEIAESMAQNGYFDEEPLVGVPSVLPSEFDNIDVNSNEFRQFILNDTTKLVIVEGNRRLATVKLLLNNDLRERIRIKNWPILREVVIEDLRSLPVIVYRKRSEVVPYLGVRHIVGIQKWESYAKARYVASMINSGMTPKDVEEQIGDKTSSVIKNYICFKMVEQIENEFDFDTKQIKNDFSFLLLSIGQGNIKRFLGLPVKLSETNYNDPVPNENLNNLKRFASWVFGDGKRKPVIKESRDITNMLTHVVASKEAVDYLDNNWDLQAAFDRSDGEETMLLKSLSTANSKLEQALGIIHRHKTSEVLASVNRCDENIKALLRSVRNIDD